jgi:hypothetical protein
MRFADHASRGVAIARRGKARAGALAKNLRAFSRGLLYARQLPPTNAPALRGPAGDLERYFDSNTEGPGIWKWRHYFDIYERHFARFRGQEVHVVEVGVYSGGSLPMWRDYFGPRARVYGVDIEPACKIYAAERIDIFIGDQADRSFWREFSRQVPRVDILIDDGGHQTHMQVTTLEEMLPRLAPGGVYLCEDTHREMNAFNAYIDGLTRSLAVVTDYVDNEPTGAQQHIASVHRYPSATVIEKPPGRPPAFEAPRHGTQWEPFLAAYAPPEPSQPPTPTDAAP